MSNYTKTTNFAAKDSLPSGNANKIVKGTEIDTEFDNIATASATKADIAGPTFTGTVTIPTVDLNGGAIDGTTVGASTAAAITGTTIVANTSVNIAGDGATVTGIKDEDDMSSNSATKLATQQSIKAYVDSQVTAQDLDFQADSGGALSIDLDSETLTFTGGTGVDTSGSGNAVTFAIDSTVATLTGTQTLTNKTLTSPTLNTPTIGTSFTIGSATITEAELEILDGATVTTAELNVLDGITSTTAELNILDGVTSTAAELNILDGVTSTTAELNILDGVTSTTAELNILDGVTASTAELNIMDGVTSTTAELNILDGVTATAAELNILDGVTSTAAELNILDGVTATTAELNYVDGVTSAIQTQIDTKAPLASPTFTGTVTATGLTVATSTDPASITLRQTGNTSGFILKNFDDDEAQLVNVDNGPMVFKTNDTERLRITGAGAVGIGATSVTARLEVTGAFGYASGANSLGTTVSKAAARIRGSSDASTSLFFGSLTNDAEQYIQSSNGAGSAADDLALNPYGGNVGIGATSPSTKLQVTGNSSSRNTIVSNVTLDGGTTVAYPYSGFGFGINFIGRDYGNAVRNYASINAFMETSSSSSGGGDAGFTAGLSFYTNGGGASDTNPQERLRIDSSGNLLVGKTVLEYSSNAGVILRNDGLLSAVRDGGNVCNFTRLSSDGEIIQLNKGSTNVGSIATWDGEIAIGRQNCALLFDDDTNRIKPHSVASNTVRDNALDMGGPSARFDDIYATNGTIQTSDRNEKQDIEALTDAEQRVAVAAKGLLRKFRWISSVQENGDDARIHFGIIAQDLQDAFTAEGLDAGRYAMFISSTWTDDDGNEQTRLGVRYSELLAFIISAI